MTKARAVLDGAAAAALRPAEDAGWRQPMLATLTDQRFSSPAWLFERKLDGVRAIVSRDGAAPHLWSRNQNPMDSSYPELVAALAERAPERFVADGEIVAFDRGRTSFTKLQGRIHVVHPSAEDLAAVPVFLYLFDLLVLGDVDVTAVPLRDRKRLLRQTFDFGGPIRMSTHRNGDGVEYLELACRRGWEGLIAKRADAPYQPGRTRDWLKFKCENGQEFVIGGYTDPAGSRVGFGALLLGYYQAGRLRYAGKVGTGFDTPTLRSMRKRLGPMTESRSPFADQVKEPRVHWVRPELVAQIGFAEWTPDGRLRHPRFQGLRTDKSATEVARESPHR
ncbi:MAG TPA: non-homologous end-joining DNA ligase [Pseudonocardiaceae bacterium]|jgi:DNA ligase D-like protein (predicted ligase)|nr:non-homologous end-joining DNA ligase [Pseudonocardiaceae bacterium]